MRELTFRGLQPDIFFAQPWFSDFADSYAKTVNGLIRYPAYRLETIRSVETQSLESVVAKQTLIQYGINLPEDFVEHNYNNLVSMLPYIANYGERSGTVDQEKLMTAILGRRVDITPLYSANYEDFYAQPHGPLQVEGGNWYKTTHVNLAMQVLPSDKRLSIPRGKKLQDRFLQAFYEFAPWSIVLSEFTFQYVHSAKLHLSGAVGKYPLRILYVGDKQYQLQSVRIDGPEEVSENSTTEYRAIAVYKLGDLIEERPVKAQFTSNRTGLVTFRNDVAEFSAVNRNTEVTISTVFNNMPATKTVTVLDSVNSELVLDIDGPDFVLMRSAQVYNVNVTKNGQTYVTDIEISTASPSATVRRNKLTAYEVEEDEMVYLQASYGNVSAVKAVTIKHIPSDTVQSLRIVADDTIKENTVGSIHAVADFGDGEIEVLADFNTTSASLLVLDDRLIAGEVDQDLVVTVEAKFQHAGEVYTAKKEIKILADDVEIVKLEIVGDYRVITGRSYKYVAVATLSDGRRAAVEADWQTSKFSMSGDVLKVGVVGSNAVNFSISADVLGHMATKSITAVEEPLTLQSISIDGPDNVNEGIVAVYRCYAHYSNGMQVEIEPEWKTRQELSWATITNDGMFSVTNPREGIVEIVATYRTGGQVFTKGRPIVIIPTTKIIRGLTITGPTTVLEGDRISFEAHATYSDGAVVAVEPVWYAESLDPVNETEVMAYIVSPGVLQGRFVEEPVQVRVVARYFQEIAEFFVTVEPRPEISPDVPESSRIIGPSVVDAEFGGSFVHAIKFENCPEETFVSTSWELDVSKDVAVISQDGFLRSVDGRSTVVTITSTFECRGRIVIDSTVVQIVGKESKLAGMEIIGQNIIAGKAPVNYHAVLHYTDGTEKRVNPTWSLVPNDGRVTVDQQGNVLVIDNTNWFDFTLHADFIEDGEEISAIKDIRVKQTARPSFGIGPEGIKTDAEITEYLTNDLPLSNVHKININTAMGEFAYLTYPVSMGLATFRDTATNFIGGWDGASWPLGDVGSVYGPIVVRRNIDGTMEDWYLYRTDFEGLGEFEFEITLGG